jgi:Leucine-rich repeat (LRR) protein
MKNFRYVPVFTMALFLCYACSQKDTHDLADVPDSYITIPDAVFEELLIAQGIDSDGVVNQKLEKADAAVIKKLEILDTYITDISGLEAFVNLEQLVVMGTSIKTIDVRANVGLDSINLFGNELIEIKGLENLSTLNYLNLSYNYFETFRLDNPHVESLLMPMNKLRSFDATSAIRLRTLNVRGNQLTAIDLSQNTEIEGVELGGNLIAELDFGTAPKLTYISCFSNNLSSLDISNFSNLTYLSANRNPNLTCIKIAVHQEEVVQMNLSAHQKAIVNCN